MVNKELEAEAINYATNHPRISIHSFTYALVKEGYIAGATQSSTVKELEREVERLKRLASLQEQYIDLLGKSERLLLPMVSIHGFKFEQKDIDEGKYLREQILELKQLNPK